MILGLLLLAAGCGSAQAPSLPGDSVPQDGGGGLVLDSSNSSSSSDDSGSIELGPTAVLCDGSSGVRLDYRLLATQETMPGEQFMKMNGLLWMRIWGDCTYQVFDGEAVREGGLSADESVQLAEDVYLGNWTQLGSWPAVGVSHPAIMSLTDSRGNGLSCGCGNPDAPKELPILAENIRRWFKTLLSQGQSVGGSMRIAAVEIPVNPPIPEGLRPYFWDLELPLSSFGIPGEDSERAAYERVDVLLEEQEGLAKLRALRSFAAESIPGEYDYGYSNYGYFLVGDNPSWQDGPVYRFHMRDVARGEQPDGRVPLP